MMRGHLVKAAACLIVSLAGAGCASSAPDYAVARNTSNHSANSCPARSAWYCDRRNAGKCRCVSEQAVRDFMRSF